MIHSLPTIDETFGVGAVRFGMHPAQVKAVLGEKLGWEEWMNGNVNDALYYPGIILFFDDYDSHGPSARGKLEHFEARGTFRALWRGTELSALTRGAVARLLGSSGQTRENRDGTCQITGPRLRARFSSNNTLESLSVGAWHGA